MSDLGGVWRTVGGRRIFIKDGEDLKTAMDRSGKFNSKKGLTKEGKEKIKELEKDEKFQKEVNDFLEENLKNTAKIIDDDTLAKMSWEEVVAKNTEYYIEKSIYDFEGTKQGKYKFEDGWRDNGGAGVIKQSDLNKLITKKDWENAKIKK